ncbi:Ctr copper transporter [Aspergillus californicus]
MDMGGMDMSDSDSEGAACVISMLWNWNTIDTCFLASSWHIRSKGMFAGSCIGVICLVVILEFLRRLAREYDAFIVHRAQAKAQYLPQSPLQSATPLTHCDAAASSSSADESQTAKAAITTTAKSSVAGAPSNFRVRPTIVEQFVRAMLHMLQFAVAYFVMLLAMYFNGYIIICIFIGAFLGSFIFSWEYMNLGVKENDATAVTKCCG